MRREKYLEILEGQIRCKKARSAVRDEVEEHILEQKEAFLREGMGEQEAEEKAVKEMGDPVEAGIALDRIHRPRMAWEMILLVGVLSLVGFMVQYLLQRQFRDQVFLPGDEIVRFVYMLIGFAMMVAVCFIDYSWIGYWAKTITAVLFAGLLFGMRMGIQVNGSRAWIFLFGVGVNMRLLCLLFVPLYGGILCSYRGQGYKAVVKSILWMLPSAFLAFILPSATTACLLMVTFIIMLGIVVYKRWFRVSRKIVLSALGGCMLLFPAAGYFALMKWGPDYQKARIQVMMNPESADGYLYRAIKLMLEGSRLVGRNPKPIVTEIPGGGEYVFTYIVSYYGILAGVILMGMIIFLFLRFFHISFRQRNQLGMIMGVGCSLVFILQVACYVMGNMGIAVVGHYCPFITYGTSGMLVTYILLGILLSIYRYQDVPVQSSRIQRKKEVLEQ